MRIHSISCLSFLISRSAAEIVSMGATFDRASRPVEPLLFAYERRSKSVEPIENQASPKALRHTEKIN
jgi:hypothetical protein